MDTNLACDVIESLSILKPSTMKIWSLRELFELPEAMEPKPIVSGLIHKGDFVLCSATAKTGKTFLAIDLALSVATGSLFLNRFPVTMGKVLYFESELSLYFAKERFRSFVTQERLEQASDNLMICKEVFNLGESGAGDFVKVLHETKPDLVIVDPLYRFHRRNEDKAQEITPVLTTIKSLAQDFDCAFFVLHHEGKKYESTGMQTSHRPRGSSAFADVPDCIISMTRDENIKGCNLSVEHRNFAAFKVQIKLNDDRNGWNVISETGADDQDRLTTSSVQMYLTENGAKTKSQLIKYFSEEHGVSNRTIERRLGDAVSIGLIAKYKGLDGQRIYSPIDNPIGLANGEKRHGGTND